MKFRVRCSLVSFGLLTGVCFLAFAQNQNAPKTPATPPAAPPARAVDEQAYFDAVRITDPEKKIEALQKHLVDFPNSRASRAVQSALLRALLTTYADKKAKLLPEIEKLIAGVPENNKAQLLNTVAWEMYLANTALEDAERYASQSLALDNELKFIKDQTEEAAANNRPIPSDETLKKRFRATRAMVQDTLGQIQVKRGKIAEGEKLLKESFDVSGDSVTATTLADLAQKRGDEAGALKILKQSFDVSGNPATAVTLADLAQKRGDEAEAFEYLLAAPAAAKARLEALYDKLHKNKPEAKSLDAMLDDRYRKLPVPHAGPYRPTPERTDRVVLAEVFTGAGCPPCVGADVAFDGMMERYARKDLVVLMYHMHIPAPDPMANPSTIARQKFYEFRGVPTYVLDGEMKTGGGSRGMAQEFFDNVTPTIEKRLETAAEARLALKASLEGAARVKVKADPSQIKGDHKDVKLQIALVEEMISYAGQNGIRLHPVVVRSLAGEGHGGFAVDVAKPADVEHVFDLAAITAELKSHLDEYEAKLPPERKFSQKKHEIDANNLSVAAFVQDQTTKQILQAAYVRLNAAGVAVNR